MTPVVHPVTRDEVVAALLAGDETAFASLVDAWSGSMLRLARLHVPTDGAAEEVVQETWLAVLRGLGSFRGESALRTWVHQILLNQAKTRGVRDRRTVPFASLTTSSDDGPVVDPARFQGPDEPHPGGWRSHPEDWPEESLLSREVHAEVRRAVDALPERQRVVVALRDLDGRSAEEVAALLGITVGHQRVLLHRGRSAVREHLDAYLSGKETGR